MPDKPYYCTDCHQLAWSEDFANLHLIAAAPDLLAACQIALQCMGYGKDPDDEDIATVRAAIAKALGETP